MIKITKEELKERCSCGDGWFPLIWELTQKLLEIVNKEGGGKDDWQITDIKEKLGGLRYGVFGGTSEMLDLIGEYEDKSETICEVCGKDGELMVRGKWWYGTRCPECALKEGYEKIKSHES